jgi:U3 small nucleolar RNA-associated protein 22
MTRKTRKVEEEPDNKTASDVEHFGGNSGAEDGISDYGDMEGDDEEEWGGVTGGQAEIEEEHRPGTKPKKPPTGEGLRAIKDAADLFRSGSFKLQVTPNSFDIPSYCRLTRLRSTHYCPMFAPKRLGYPR